MQLLMTFSVYISASDSFSLEEVTSVRGLEMMDFESLSDSFFYLMMR